MSLTPSHTLRLAAAALSLASVLPAGATRPLAIPVVRANANTARAGVLRNGLLSVTLEARASSVHLDGAERPPMTIEAFAEPGKDPLMPGPLIRAPQGTELRLSIRNSLHTPLTLFVPAVVRGGPAGPATDSLVVAPGALGQMTLRLATPGNYVYRAATTRGASQVMGYAGLLAGAVVVDSVGAQADGRDRVFVIMETGDSVWDAFADTARSGTNPGAAAPVGRFVFTINGRPWPRTERIHATTGDSLHWRIVNASPDPHPMHLHGFYYRVDSYSGPLTARFGQPTPNQMVVTQLLSPFAAMSMTWSPTRPGNWLFHCHFALHNMPDSISASRDDPDMRGMTGLVLGIEVGDRPGIVAAGAPTAAHPRRIRLIAEGGRAKPGQPIEDSVPPMRLVMDEGGRHIEGGPDFSPELDLVRGEPVAITIVNHLGEPTTVHWHGIEVENSYMDGVPGFSGAGRRLTPEIAPGDSFVARFTPPRAGTFMYHAHLDDMLQQTAGMEGALIVREPADTRSGNDHVFFLKGRNGSRVHPLEVNGRANPDTVVLHAGEAARFRLINLSAVQVAPNVWLTARADSARVMARDTMLVRWVPLAKDGFDLPATARTTIAARAVVAVGETYDFAYTPRSRGVLRLEFRTNGAAHPLLIRVPIRVE
jgi:manganese oxidase